MKAIVKWAVSFSFLLSSSQGLAQPDLPNNYHFKKLSNGMKVLIIEDPSNPLVHFDMVLRFGAIAEDERLNGLAHLFEHMAFTATDLYPTTLRFQDEILKLGIIPNALTNEESVHYYFSLNSSRWEAGLALFAEGIINPIFLEQELELQKSAIKDELNILASDPYYMLGQTSNKALWGSQHMRKDVSGDIDNILKADSEFLFDLEERYYHPNNALLIVAGDIQKEEVMPALMDEFDQWEHTQNSPSLTSDYSFQKLTATDYVLLESSSVESPALLVSWQGPGNEDMNSQIAASLFFYLLNLSTSSFYQDLNEKDYVYDYFAGIRFGSQSSTLFMEFYPDIKTTDELILWLEGQITTWLKNEPISDQMLSLAKSKWEAEHTFEKEKLSEYVLELGDRWAIGDEALSLEFEERIQSVTLQDVKRLINNYLDQPRVYGLVIQPNKSKRLHKSIRSKFLPE